MWSQLLRKVEQISTNLRLKKSKGYTSQYGGPHMIMLRKFMQKYGWELHPRMFLKKMWNVTQVLNRWPSECTTPGCCHCVMNLRGYAQSFNVKSLTVSLYGPNYPLVKCLLAQHLWPVFVTHVLLSSATGTESSSLNVIKTIRIGKEYINPLQRIFLWVPKIKWLTFRSRRPACSFRFTELCVRKFRTGQWCRQSRMGPGLPTLVQYCLQQSATKGLCWNSNRPTGQPYRGCDVVMNDGKWWTDRRRTRASARHSLLSKCHTFYNSCMNVVIFTLTRKLQLFLEPIFTKVARAQWR
jgi:hypothetical protein